MTKERREDIRRLSKRATPGPWTTEKPGRDTGTGFPAGVIIAAVARGCGVYADPPGGSFPESDRQLIAAMRNAIDELLDDSEQREGLLRDVELEPRQIEALWRSAGLAEYFLGNSGSNHKLYAFAALCRAATPEKEP